MANPNVITDLVGLPKQPDRPGDRPRPFAIHHHLTHYHSFFPMWLSDATRTASPSPQREPVDKSRLTEGSLPSQVHKDIGGCLAVSALNILRKLEDSVGMRSERYRR